MSDAISTSMKKSVRGALVLAGVQVGGALLLTLADKLGWIGGDTATRGVMVLIGLCLAVVGNAMPKQHEGPAPQSAGEIAVRQSITRVGGWAMMLGALVWVALWVFAPRGLAVAGSVAAVGTAVVVMLAYAVWRYRVWRRSAAS